MPVLTITVAAWTQVEYRAKQLAAWSTLMSDRSTDMLSLSIDYFSPLRIVALRSSIGNRHWSAALAMLGTLLLGLTTVVSTGLLERRNQPIAIPIDNLIMTAVFAPEARFALDDA